MTNGCSKQANGHLSEHKRQSSTLKSLIQKERERERDGDLQASRGVAASWQLSVTARVRL